MNLIGAWAARDGLIIPKQLAERNLDDKSALKKRFYKELDDFVREHEDETEPYFILFRSTFQKETPTISRQAFAYYEKRPPLITNSIVFFVDNQRGNLFFLWQVDSQKRVEWNTEFAAKLRGTLRRRVAA